MFDARGNQAAAGFDLKHAGQSKKKRQSCIRKIHFAFCNCDLCE